MKEIDIEELEGIYNLLTGGDNDRLAIEVRLLTDVMKLAYKHGVRSAKNVRLLHIAAKIIEVMAEDEASERIVKRARYGMKN